MTPLRRHFIAQAVLVSLLPLLLLALLLSWDASHSHALDTLWRPELIGLFAVCALASILLAIFVGGRLGHFVAEPLDVLSDTARKVQQGQWELVPHVAGPAEVRALSRDLNRMIERLRRLLTEAESGRNQLETVVGQMDDGLIVLNREGRISRLNPVARQLLALEAAAPLGRSLLEVYPNYSLEAVARRALAGERPEPVEVQAPGGERALRFLISPLHPQRSPEGVVILIQDLTEIRRVDQMRRDFVANVGHEFKTPIAAVRAMAETLLLRGERHPELALDYGRQIGEQMERLGKLVEDLMTLSRIESGAQTLVMQDLDAAVALQEVASRFQAAAKEAGVSLVVGSSAAAKVWVDAGALDTALGNIVDNALKYTPRGGEVRLSSREQESEVVFTIEDTGIGIASEDLPRVFERFYRVDPARSREIEGTGLGLAIVKHLCELTGGRAIVESAPGAGTRFHLAFRKGGQEQ